MPKILIQFAHPAFSKSRVQKTLLRHCRGLKGVTVNDLYEQYPDLYIDIKREQQLLEAHDIIVLQHPFYWYSGPAILKQWQDLVLEYNWAYGPRGKALKGKQLLTAISCGVTEGAYGADGVNEHAVGDFLLPYRQTALLCGMDYLPPFVVYGAHKVQQSMLDDWGLQYAGILSGLASGAITADHYRRLTHINHLPNVL